MTAYESLGYDIYDYCICNSLPAVIMWSEGLQGFIWRDGAEAPKRLSFEELKQILQKLQYIINSLN